MLASDLGYRPPSAGELARIALRYARHPWPRVSPATVPVVQTSLISAAPFVSYSGISRAPLGMASLLPDLPRDHRGWFLLSPTWALDRSSAKMARARAVAHRLGHPHHAFVFLGNAPVEVDLMHGQGEAAVCINKTCAVSEEAFRPLGEATTEFDAVYNARLVPWKRHELTLGVERCSFLFYRDSGGETTAEQESAIIARHARLAPGHVFVNALLSPGQPVRLPPDEVNRHLNRAAVGLCLSEVEGPMFAGVEYLLAGLAVVTTPNKGGRDVFLDPEFSLTVPPDPRAVAEAVAALKARQIPRAYIRARTLERVERHRARFIDLVNAIFAEEGSPQRLAGPWPFRRPVIMRWLPPAVAIERARAGTVDAFTEEPSG